MPSDDAESVMKCIMYSSWPPCLSTLKYKGPTKSF